MERSNGLTSQAIREFKEVIVSRRKNGQKQKIFDYGWYGNKYNGANDYSGTFRSILEMSVNDGNIPPGDLKEIIRRKRLQVGVPMVLDVMGYGAVLDSLNVDGCAVAMTDQRRRKMRRLDEELGRGFIAGDVREGKTWRDVRKWQENRGRKFDVILCRPLGGLSLVNQNETFYRYIFNNLYEMLSQENGMLFIEYSWQMKPLVFKETAGLNDIPGLFANANWHTFFLEKHFPAPEKLSNLPNFG